MRVAALRPAPGGATGGGSSDAVGGGLAVAQAGSGGWRGQRSAPTWSSSDGGAGEARRRDKEGRRRCVRRRLRGVARGDRGTGGGEGEGLEFGCIDPTIVDNCTNLKQ